MFEKMDILTKAVGLAQHAAARQSVIAQNVANADTPGYRAKDIASFADTFRDDNRVAMQATRASHLNGSAGQTAPDQQTVHRAGAMSPNGNSVALETEMMAAAEAKRDHDLALTVYKTSLGIMRTALGRR
ncbi:FlgB family protein [Aliiroseovarius sp. Z3]|uniref:FlgB family protein n=1 Tax=Aliiroseovarius sp. Z3 TaxID=2811402 RepID=UPI0023B27898|nr:FlgB family protein [Aliiroseovarius sp. Z3]MDE9450079.1 FlgB family protein [Aliiroseovarius sp. Z3]